MEATPPLNLNQEQWASLQASKLRAEFTIREPVRWPWRTMGQCPIFAELYPRNDGEGELQFQVRCSRTKTPLFTITPPYRLGPVALFLRRPVCNRVDWSKRSLVGTATVVSIEVEQTGSQSDERPIPQLNATYDWIIRILPENRQMSAG